MQEYLNIRDRIDDVKTILVLGKGKNSAAIILNAAKMSLEFMPDIPAKKRLEKEIRELEAGIEPIPFYIGL